MCIAMLEDRKDPTKSLVYNQREEDMKHFDIEAINRQEMITKKQNMSMYCSSLLLVS